MFIDTIPNAQTALLKKQSSDTGAMDVLAAGQGPELDLSSLMADGGPKKVVLITEVTIE